MKLNLKMIALIIGSSVVLSCNTHHNKKSKKVGTIHSLKNNVLKPSRVHKEVK